MKNDDILKEKLLSLETNLIAMFRLCQNLYSLAKEERQVLVDGRANELDGLAEKKMKVLDGIEKTEKDYQLLIKDIAMISGFKREVEKLSDLLVNFGEKEVEQIKRMQEGILVLQKDIKELNDGNYALAKLNVQHLEAVQGFIVNNIYPSSSYYGPDKNLQKKEPLTNWQMDQRA